MRGIVVLAFILGCRGIPSQTRQQQVDADRAKADAGRDAALAKLTARVESGDERTIRALFADSVGFGGMWFSDPDCRAQFMGAGRLEGPALATFVRCLTTVPIERGDRQHAYRDVGVLTYAPGIEVEVLFERDNDDDIKVRYVGFAGRSGTKDALPTVSEQALLALRVDPAPVALDDATRVEIDAERASQPRTPTPNPIVVWFKLCIDAQGTVTSARPRWTTSLVAQDAFAAILSTWRFQPFVLGGQPTPVCALVHLGDPTPPGRESRLPGTVPDEAGGRVVVANLLLGKRVAGDELDSITIREAQRLKKLGSRPGEASTFTELLLCVDETGKVDRVQLLRSSGLPSYDRRLLGAIATWRFAPLRSRGRPVPACASWLIGVSLHWR